MTTESSRADEIRNMIDQLEAIREQRIKQAEEFASAIGAMIDALTKREAARIEAELQREVSLGL